MLHRRSCAAKGGGRPAGHDAADQGLDRQRRWHVSLAKETLDLALKTDARRFSVGSLPTRIDIGGTLKNPKIQPGAGVAARAGAAAGLGVLFAPLALLPTIQLGLQPKRTRAAANCSARLGPPPAARRCRAATPGQRTPVTLSPLLPLDA